MSQVQYKKYGEGCENLLLLHGWGTSSEYWQPLLPYLRETFTVYCIDLPGCGDNRTSKLSLFEFMSKIEQDFKVDFYVCGWSLGGSLATILSDICRTRVKGLITISSNPKFIEDVDWPGIEADKFKSMQNELESASENLLQRFRALILGKAMSEIRQMDDVMSLYDLDALREGLNFLSAYDVRGILSLQDNPQLHIFGDSDPLVPKSVINSMRKLLPDSEIYTLAGGLHAPFIYFPEAVADRMKRFCHV